ncbi:hypothetical protein BC835DRAFT_1305907 [Cytidiella melzeri]|nr:hypothetical protein BC835DRAFT_1305907 [Cytidiella melzeri]
MVHSSDKYLPILNLTVQQLVHHGLAILRTAQDNNNDEENDNKIQNFIRYMLAGCYVDGTHHEFRVFLKQPEIVKTGPKKRIPVADVPIMWFGTIGPGSGATTFICFSELYHRGRSTTVGLKDWLNVYDGCIIPVLKHAASTQVSELPATLHDFWTLPADQRSQQAGAAVKLRPYLYDAKTNLERSDAYGDAQMDMDIEDKIDKWRALVSCKFSQAGRRCHIYLTRCSSPPSCLNDPRHVVRSHQPTWSTAEHKMGTIEELQCIWEAGGGIYQYKLLQPDSLLPTGVQATQCSLEGILEELKENMDSQQPQLVTSSIKMLLPMQDAKHMVPILDDMTKVVACIPVHAWWSLMFYRVQAACYALGWLVFTPRMGRVWRRSLTLGLTLICVINAVVDRLHISQTPWIQQLLQSSTMHWAVEVSEEGLELYFAEGKEEPLTYRRGIYMLADLHETELRAEFGLLSEQVNVARNKKNVWTQPKGPSRIYMELWDALPHTPHKLWYCQRIQLGPDFEAAEMNIDRPDEDENDDWNREARLLECDNLEAILGYNVSFNNSFMMSWRSRQPLVNTDRSRLCHQLKSYFMAPSVNDWQKIAQVLFPPQGTARKEKATHFKNCSYRKAWKMFYWLPYANAAELWQSDKLPGLQWVTLPPGWTGAAARLQLLQFLLTDYVEAMRYKG